MIDRATWRIRSTSSTWPRLRSAQMPRPQASSAIAALIYPAALGFLMWAMLA
jgi:hypothetical protein